MTIFEYFLVLFSMILSITLTHLASGVGELVRSPKRVAWSLPYALWIVLIGQTVLDMWSSAWLMRGTVVFNMGLVVFLLATALSTYLAALWLVPREVGEERIDLYTHMIDQRRYFMGAFIFYLAAGICWNLYLLPPGKFDLANYAVAGPMLAATIVAWITPVRPVQYAVPILGAILVMVYYAYFFPSIG